MFDGNEIHLCMEFGPDAMVWSELQIQINFLCIASNLLAVCVLLWLRSYFCNHLGHLKFMLDSYISIASNRMPFSAVHTIAIKVEIWDGNEKWAKTNGVDVCVCVFSFLPSEMTSDLNLLSVIYGLYWILFCVPMFRSRLQPRWWWGNPWCVYDFYDEPFPVCCR